MPTPLGAGAFDHVMHVGLLLLLSKPGSASLPNIAQEGSVELDAESLLGVTSDSFQN